MCWKNLVEHGHTSHFLFLISMVFTGVGDSATLLYNITQKYCHVLTLVPLFLYGQGVSWGGQSVCFSMLFFVFGLVWFSIRGRCR